jgi:hypothetical protein
MAQYQQARVSEKGFRKKFFDQNMLSFNGFALVLGLLVLEGSLVIK